jgi:hypothetical protein
MLAFAKDYHPIIGSLSPPSRLLPPPPFFLPVLLLLPPLLPAGLRPQALLQLCYGYRSMGALHLGALQELLQKPYKASMFRFEVKVSSVCNILACKRRMVRWIRGHPASGYGPLVC